MSVVDRPQPAPGTGAGEGTWLERIVESFEDRWESGPRPSIDDYLPADGPARHAALVELVHVELERRLKAGEAARVEDYLRRYPELAGDRAVILNLIVAERELRSRREPALTHDEYQRRFPHLDSVLLGIVPGVPTAEPATAPLIPTTQVHPGAGPPALVAIPGAPKVDGYEIHDELGRGGMGIVYKARHVALNRLVALKMALPGVTVAPEAQERIRLEAEAVAHLQHPNIVQIYEAGSQDGRRYFSLEFVPGGTLARKLGGDPQPSDAAARMVRTLARAVHAAHGRGVVHRDLKPANVLLAEDGTPKIADFGLAKRLDVAEGLSLSGEVKGTPSYMAPEQAAGKTREVGPAADIHALGAILYKMLTGRPPFKAATIEATLAQVIDQEPVPPGRLLPRLPRDVETICLKCLEKDPSRRYATAEALAEDLRRFLDGEPIVARPVGAAARALKWARRRPAEAALVAVLTLAVPGALIGVLVHREQQAQFRLRDLTRAAAERQRLLELRAAVQARMLEGQGAVAREDWPDAKLHLTTALNLSRPEPTLADLGARAASLLEQVDPRLDDQARRTDAVKRLATFRTRRDDALFRATLVLFTGRVRAADLEATRAAARAALALFGVGVDPGAPTAVNVSSLEADEPAEVNAGCYEMLLTLAEAEAQVLPGQPPERARDGAERALRLLDRAARLGPDTRAAHLRRARYLAQLGDPSGAARERRRAAEVDPSTATDFYLVGDEARRDGDLKAALRDFEEALTRQPDHFWATFGQASCRMRLGRWDAAVASLTACLGRRPDFAWLYPLRALAHAELREFDAAEADLNKAADHTLDDYTRYSLLVSRAVVRLARGDDPAAVVDLEAAITLRPDWHQARVNLAQVELSRGRPDAALAQLDLAIAGEPTLAPLYRERAEVHRRQGDRAGALRDLDEAIRLEPLGREAAHDHAGRGQILQEDGDLPGALRAYDAALALDPGRADVHRSKAEVLTRLAEAEPAPSRPLQEQIVAALDACLATGPPAAAVYRARGQARATLGDYGGALDDYTHALGLEPDPATFTARGWTYLLAFDAPAPALRDFEAALGLDPKNGDATNGRGFARVKGGDDVRRAVADADEALRLGPEKALTLCNAARTYAQAVGRFDARTVPRDVSPALRGRYQDRAVQLLRRAVALVPASRRGAFWKEMIEPDAALAPIRRSAGFLQLIVENAGAGK